MLISPNLPNKPISKALVSADITPDIINALTKLGIELFFVEGTWNCDPAVKNHPDIYFLHFDYNMLYHGCNICSIKGDLSEFNNQKAELLINCEQEVLYKKEVILNSVIIGNDLICNTALIHPIVHAQAVKQNKRILNVKQGYTKCNICIVDNKSIITEDVGIYKTLIKYGYDVLLLKTHSVKLPGHEYGFIGGASGKISADKIAFYGNIEKHPEYDLICRFLKRKGVEAISLSEEQLVDYGSLLPIS